MVRGDIVLVDLPRPIGNAGHEQFGQRPAIIVQNDDATTVLSTVVAVPLTTVTEAVRFFGAFRIEPNRTNGLSKTSVALVHQVGPIDKRRIGRKIGKVPARDLTNLEEKLRQLLRL
jgi:mRNA interferase MazF